MGILIISLFTSCENNTEKNDRYKWEVISQTTAFNVIYFTNGVQCLYGPQLTSNPYCVPTKEWIQDVYIPSLKKFLWDNQVNIPVEFDNNCVKFSSYGLTVGSILHSNGRGPRKSSLAIGVTDYVQGFSDWHSINVFLVQDGFGGYELFYFDPQTLQEVPSEDLKNSWIMFRM